MADLNESEQLSRARQYTPTAIGELQDKLNQGLLGWLVIGFKYQFVGMIIGGVIAASFTITVYGLLSQREIRVKDAQIALKDTQIGLYKQLRELGPSIQPRIPETDLSSVTEPGRPSAAAREEAAPAPPKAIDELQAAHALASAGNTLEAFRRYTNAYQLLPSSSKRTLDQTEIRQALAVQDLGDPNELGEGVAHFEAAFSPDVIRRLRQGG